MATTITLRLDDSTYRAFAQRARSENRSIANFIETAVKQHLEEIAFADDDEMASLLANDRLVARLRKGSADARARHGKMIG